MKNMSDGKSDGIIIMYAKDGTIYPVALSTEQIEMMDITIGLALQNNLTIVNKPQGSLRCLNNGK